MRVSCVAALALCLCATGAHAQEEEGASDELAAVTGGFVGVDWRVMGLAGHVSHGPGFQAGVIFWRHLRVGIAGFARPGPLNPATFEVTPVAGRTYKGKSTLELRSDGAFFGLMVAPAFDIEGVVALEAPVTLGQAAFGFYLTGSDRETPDGRRVSAWENELLDGRDSGVGLGLDAGVRVSIIASTWLRPYVGVHYTTVFGFDSYVSDSYAGPSMTLGVQLGKFR